VIFFVGAQLIVSSFSDLIDGSHSAVPSSLTMIVPIISMVGKILLAISQYRLGKKAQSPMIMANAKNMSSDVLISLGVLIGFGISHLTGSAHADSIVAILIGAWVIKTALGIFIDANLELKDEKKNMRSYHVIVEAVDAVDGASTPHRARIRCVGGFWDISFDIFVDPNCTVSQAHKIASKVEKEIKARLENVYDVMIHVEPMGDDTKEVFGLSEDDLKKSV
jgi:cation diffusion facilitator family transporter